MVEGEGKIVPASRRDNYITTSRKLWVEDFNPQHENSILWYFPEVLRWGILMGRLFRGSVALLALMAASRSEAADRPLAMPLKTPAASQNADDPCDGLLSVLDRPTVADSPCVVKPGQAVVELGYQSGPVKGSDIGHLSFLPQAELRFGLPDNWELKIFPPNYLTATQRAFAGGGQIKGFGDTAFGIKHEFGYSNGFVFAADAKVIVPTGDTAFSDGGTEANIQGIISYSITPKLGISGMLGVSTLTNRGADGSITRFTSMNPDLVVTYLITDKLQIYSELFGNTVTSPGQGPNFTIQGGVQYLLAPSVEVDASVGTLLLGPAGLQSSYINFGLGLQFSAH